MARGTDGNDDDDAITSSVDWIKSIKSVLENAEEGARQVKKIRKMVLLSLQLDDGDKGAKKHFKKAVQGMEQDGVLKLDSDGTIHLLQKTTNGSNDSSKKKKRKSPAKEGTVKKDKKEKKKQKKRKIVDSTDEERKNAQDDGSDDDGKGDDDDGIHDDDDDDDDDDKPHQQIRAADDGENAGTSSGVPAKAHDKEKNKPCKGNPQGVTRLFLGNLPFAVDEASLSSFLPGQVTHIKWITDKETGKFYGSAFCEMDNSKSAAEAVAMAGSKLIGRPIKINFAPAREGDVWPPAKKVVSGNVTGAEGAGAGGGGGSGGGQAGGSGIKAMSAKPDNCTKLFIGNLSYDIDDETITKFFANVDAEVKAVRWLHHKDSGDFKGVGFVEFWNTDACEKAATLNGKNLLGRPIRIDWTD
jgi:RNA recognition motif-containing protein